MQIAKNAYEIKMKLIFPKKTEVHNNGGFSANFSSLMPLLSDQNPCIKKLAPIIPKNSQLGTQ